MKTIKTAVAVILVQAALCAAAYAEAARPIAVDIRVEAGAGALAAKSAEISEALLSGRNADADQLLADLYSGGIRKEEAAPVQAAAGCHCCHQAPAAAVAVSTAAVTAAAPAAAPAAAAADPFAKDPISKFVRDEEAKKKEADAKAKEKNEEAEEKAKKQKAFNWGVTIMTIALLLLLIL